MTGLLFAALSALMCVVSARDIVPPIPVVVQAHGLRYQPAEPKPQLQLEIFIDLHCPDSLYEWGIMKQVQAFYGPSKIDLVVQQMPLPYHRNSFLATKALFVILNSTVSSQVFNYIDESLSMWSNFSTANTVNLSELQVQDMIADMAVRTTGIDRAYFIANIPAHTSDARTVWKYAAKRAVPSTPTFFLNNVDLGTGADLPNYQEWLAFLDPLVSQVYG
jgi:hypothetical protein